MSSIHNVISTVFTARSGQAVAQMQQYRGQLTNISNGMVQAGKNSSYLNAQMRAIGTTLRYAFAGSAVFGLVQMGQELVNIQKQMALMKAVGDVTDDAGKKIAISGQQLNKWQEQVAAAAPGVLTSTTDMNDAIVNLLSSVQGFKASEVVPAMEVFATGAGIAQTTVEELVTGMTQLNTIFGRDHTLKNYTSLVESFVAIVREVPGGKQYGRMFLQQLPALSAQARAAGATPEELLGTYMTTARALPPAIAGRGLSFAFLSLFKPGNEDAAEAIKRLGITPESLTKEGPIAAFRKIFAEINPRGQAGLRGMINTPITEEQGEEEVTTETLRGLGIEGRGLKLLSTIFTRIHGLRAFAAIAGQPGKGGVGYKLDEDLAMIHDVFNGLGKESKDIRKSMAQFNRDQPLMEFSKSLQAIRSQISRDFGPGLNFLTQEVLNPSTKWFRSQDQTTRRIEEGALVAGGIGAWAMMRRRGAKGVGRAGAGGLMALSDIGNEGLGASPLTPMYVVVVNTLFGGGGGGGIFGPGGRGGPRDPITGQPTGRGRGKWGGRLRGAGRLGARIPFGGAAVGIGTAGLGMAAWELAFPEDAGAAESSMYAGDPFGKMHALRLHRARQADMDKYMGGKDAVQSLYGFQRVKDINGRALIELDVLLKHPDGSTERKRVAMPAEVWTKGATPGRRGKPGSTSKGSSTARPPGTKGPVK